MKAKEQVSNHNFDNNFASPAAGSNELQQLAQTDQEVQVIGSRSYTQSPQVPNIQENTARASTLQKDQILSPKDDNLGTGKVFEINKDQKNQRDFYVNPYDFSAK